MKAELEEYFNTVKRALGLPNDLRLVIKKYDPRYKGKVEGNVVYVYTNNVNEAKSVILHECVDLLISTLLKYAIHNINDSDGVYKVKEAIVNTICDLVGDEQLERAEAVNYISRIFHRLKLGSYLEKG